MLDETNQMWVKLVNTVHVKRHGGDKLICVDSSLILSGYLDCRQIGL